MNPTYESIRLGLRVSAKMCLWIQFEILRVLGESKKTQASVHLQLIKLTNLKN